VAAPTPPRAYRLARFNVAHNAEEAGLVPAKKSDSFTGLPIPGGAGVIVGAVLALGFIPSAVAVPLFAAVTLLGAGAMVSTFPYPAFKKGGLKALRLPAAAAIAAAAGLVIAGLWALIPAAIFGGYLLAGPAVKLYEGGSEAFKKEVLRKGWHQFSLLYLAAYFLIGYPAIIPAMTAWVTVVGALELVRLKVPRAKPIFDKLFGKLIREKEADRLSGVFYVSLGLFAALVLFGSSPVLVTAAALYLAWGDAISALVGMRFGRREFKVNGVPRTLEGAAAGFAVALAIGLGLGFSPLVALGAALAFSAMDIYPVKPDDNLWIPVVATTALYLLSRFLA
jgi:dolichol kinase